MGNLMKPRGGREDLLGVIDVVEEVLTDLVHDWETLPAELRDRINERARLPLLRLLIAAERRRIGVSKAGSPEIPPQVQE